MLLELGLPAFQEGGKELLECLGGLSPTELVMFLSLAATDDEVWHALDAELLLRRLDLLHRLLDLSVGGQELLHIHLQASSLSPGERDQPVGVERAPGPAAVGEI